MVETEKSTLKILLVEDTPGDVRLITEGFKRTGLNVQLRVAEDGEEALNVLFSEDAIDPPFFPDLVLLDLNIPLVSGHEVLELIKTNKKLADIPVIILTSSLLDEDLKRAHDHSADLYVIKPINLSDYFEAVGQIAQFWTDRKKKNGA